MKYEFELTLVCRSVVREMPLHTNVMPSPNTPKKYIWDTKSIDVVKGSNLTELLGQFLIVLASVHRRIVEDVKTELRIIDDDIPF